MRRAAIGVVVVLFAGPGAGSAGAAAGEPSAGDPTPAKAVHLQVAVNGDLLIHSPIYNRAKALGGGRRYEFRPMLRYVRPIVRAADLGLCHVETPMGPGPPHGYPRFNTPRGLCLLYTSPSPRDGLLSRMPSSA